jgi:hypothetical protein
MDRCAARKSRRDGQDLLDLRDPGDRRRLARLVEPARDCQMVRTTNKDVIDDLTDDPELAANG